MPVAFESERGGYVSARFFGVPIDDPGTYHVVTFLDGEPLRVRYSFQILKIEEG